MFRAVVVTQLVEFLLSIPEVRGLKPVIGKLLHRTLVYYELYRKDKNKEKEAGNGPFTKLIIFSSSC